MNRNSKNNKNFKRPKSVIIVAHPENSKLQQKRPSRKPKKNGQRNRKRQVVIENTTPMPAESAHDEVMDICGWMRDDGYLSDELHKNIYKPALDNDPDMLLAGIRKHIKTNDKRLASYLKMMRDIIKDTEKGASGAR